MDAVARNIPTHIALGGQTIPFWVMAPLILLAELALCFIVFAIMRPRELFLWIVACVAIAITWAWLVYRESHGSRDWDRTPHLEVRDARIAFVPDRRMCSMGYEKAEAPFPSGARLEYHVETGDLYIDHDRSQVLRRSLWVVEPTGRSQQLLDSAAYLNVRTAAANLQIAGIPFRIIKVYDGPAGEHTETDTTAEYVHASSKARRMTPIAILIGTSSLWLGAVAGALAQGSAFVIAIGILGYAVVATATVASRPTLAKRTALIQVVTLIPTYAAGYAVVAILVRHLFQR
jgi:hypothetical protein